MTFTLSDRDGTTGFSMSYDYEPQGGPLALIYGPVLDRLLTKGFTTSSKPSDQQPRPGPTARANSPLVAAALTPPMRPNR